MQNTLRFESKFLLSEASFSFNSNGKTVSPLCNSFSLIDPSLSVLPSKISLLNQCSVLSFSIYSKPQILNPITCARNSRRRTGHQRSTKWILKSLYFVASNLKILPEPFALAITAFGGGNGGGIGFRKGIGGGWFDGWRRRRKKRKNRLGFLGFVMICGIGMWLVVVKDFDSDVFLGVMALSLLGVSIGGWKNRGFKDWVLGFCCCASLVGFGFRKEKLQSLGKGFGAMETLRRRK